MLRTQDVEDSDVIKDSKDTDIGIVDASDIKKSSKPTPSFGTRKKGKELYDEYLESVYEQLGEIEVSIRKSLGLYSISEYIVNPLAAPIFATEALKIVEYSKGELQFPLVNLLESIKKDNTVEILGIDISDDEFMKCIMFSLLYVFDTPIVTTAFQFASKPVDLDMESFFVILASWSLTSMANGQKISQETHEYLLSGNFDDADDSSSTVKAIKEIFSVLKSTFEINTPKELDPYECVAICSQKLFDRYKEESSTEFKGTKLFNYAGMDIEIILNSYIQLSMKPIFKYAPEAIHFVEEILKRFNAFELGYYSRAHLVDVPELYPEGFTVIEE